MCWNIESSVISAIYGYAVSVYLYHRRYSNRDPWYAVFLATFTTTQVIDAFFWYIAGEGAAASSSEFLLVFVSFSNACAFFLGGRIFLIFSPFHTTILSPLRSP